MRTHELKLLDIFLTSYVFCIGTSGLVFSLVSVFQPRWSIENLKKIDFFTTDLENFERVAGAGALASAIATLLVAIYRVERWWDHKKFDFLPFKIVFFVNSLTNTLKIAVGGLNGSPLSIVQLLESVCSAVALACAIYA